MSNLNLADPTFLDDSEIDVLLGADIYALRIQEGVIKGRPDEPIATLSLLGWIITGPIPLTLNRSSHVTLQSFHCAQDKSLSEILQNFWRQEEPPTTKFLTPDEQKCEEHYVKNVKREPNGLYNVKLPFKNPVNTPLGNSFNKAVSMLKHMERKFDNDTEFKRLYFDFIGDYISSGHMIPITDDSPLRKPIDQTYFMPPPWGTQTSKYHHRIKDCL